MRSNNWSNITFLFKYYIYMKYMYLYVFIYQIPLDSHKYMYLLFSWIFCFLKRTADKHSFDQHICTPSHFAGWIVEFLQSAIKVEICSWWPSLQHQLYTSKHVPLQWTKVNRELWVTKTYLWRYSHLCCNTNKKLRTA